MQAHILERKRFIWCKLYYSNIFRQIACTLLFISLSTLTQSSIHYKCTSIYPSIHYLDHIYRLHPVQAVARWRSKVHPGQVDWYRQAQKITLTPKVSPLNLTCMFWTVEEIKSRQVTPRQARGENVNSTLKGLSQDPDQEPSSYEATITVRPILMHSLWNNRMVTSLQRT